MSIPRIDPLSAFSDTSKGLTLAIGNFDGVHLGHQALIARACEQAKDGVAVVTFTPNPKKYFQPTTAPNRLMRPNSMDRKLASLGVSCVFDIAFNAALAQMTDAEFVDQILDKACKAQAVIVGEDFRFGRHRMGDAASLYRHGTARGIEVHIVKTLPAPANAAPDKISSTMVRNFLRQGAPLKASELLGHAWVMEGKVVKGEQLGRTIGFPTANLDIADLLHPKHGIYAIKARINQTGTWHTGVANFGRTPTTGLRDPFLEAYLFDFKQDIYNDWLEVALLSYLRPEIKFDTLDDMVHRMHEDCQDAKNILSDCRVAMPQ